MHEWQSQSHVKWEMQVPRCDCTEVPQEVVVRKTRDYIQQQEKLETGQNALDFE